MKNPELHFDGVDLEELAKYSPEKITADIMVDLMAELHAWRNVVNWRTSETPEELEAYISDLEELSSQCNNKKHTNFDDYKLFFDDCVSTLEDIGGRCPCAEPYDNALKNYVLECITAGAEKLEAELTK